MKSENTTVIPATPNPVFTYLLTYTMEQSPSLEANWLTDSQEITRS